jgi:transcriptional regulator with XRE-family HTH domain
MRLRELRASRGIALKDMAQALDISSAYLSALEHGKRGRPSWYLLQNIIAYFNIIWDEAEELVALARLSHPRITIDTAGLDPRATELANRMADTIATLDGAALDTLLGILTNANAREGMLRNKKGRSRTPRP